MPSGERSQVWYPSVVALLRREWHANITWHEVFELRDKLQLELDRHQRAHGIVRATFRCPDCGAVGLGAPPSISVRAMLIALRRFEIEPAEQSLAREREWKRYRATHLLDLHGRTLAVPAVSDESQSRCAHRPRRNAG